jgi:hypothetical protein
MNEMQTEPEAAAALPRRTCGWRADGGAAESTAVAVTHRRGSAVAPREQAVRRLPSADAAPRRRAVVGMDGGMDDRCCGHCGRDGCVGDPREARRGAPVARHEDLRRAGRGADATFRARHRCNVSSASLVLLALLALRAVVPCQSHGHAAGARARDLQRQQHSRGTGAARQAARQAEARGVRAEWLPGLAWGTRGLRAAARPARQVVPFLDPLGILSNHPAARYPRQRGVHAREEHDGCGAVHPTVGAVRHRGDFPAVSALSGHQAHG